MARIKSIIQPFGNPVSRHQEIVAAILDPARFDRFLIPAAYVREKGVHAVAASLSRLGDRVCVFAGGGDDVTSTDGLLRLLDCGVRLYLVRLDTPGVRIFHPKVYAGWTATEAEILLGSANFTHHGLHNNVEISFAATFDLGDPDDRLAYDMLIGHFEAWEATPRPMSRA